MIHCFRHGGKQIGADPDESANLSQDAGPVWSRRSRHKGVWKDAFAAEPVALPRQALGKTGLQVSLFGLGCGVGPFPGNRRAQAVALVHRALELGVNYFDTAPTYGASEDCLGEALAGRRSEIVLATKTQDRSRDNSWRLLERSLKRLRTDYIDVWQIHNTRADISDVDAMFAADGAIKAMEQARSVQIGRASCRERV